MRTILSGLLALVGFLPAQGMQLSTENVDPVAWHNGLLYTGTTITLPFGPVTFPTTLFAGLAPRLTLTANANAVTVRGSCFGTGWGMSGYSWTRSDLVTSVTMPSPARISIQVQNLFTPPTHFATPFVQFGVDLGADGQDEFFSTSQLPTTTSTLTTHCDDVGSLVRWHHYLSAGSWSLYSNPTTELTVRFVEPVQEPTYGPTCDGKLGCQLGISTYDRIFVASLPSDSTFAWLLGGDQQWNVQFPSFNCPLLVNPQLILAVPVFDGPNDRKFVDFEVTFPPIPGLVFYAQGIAISGGTFVGTNGVRIQT